MEQLPDGFKRREYNVGIYEKIPEIHKCKEIELLVGPKKQKKGRIGGGFFMFTGGNRKKKDNTAVDGAKREGLEETGFTVGNAHYAAELHVTILKKKRFNVVPVFLFTTWTGELEVCKEFEWLKFIPLSKMQWDKHLPREEEWVKRILIKHIPTLVRITCGKDTSDVLSMEFDPLPPPDSRRKL